MLFNFCFIEVELDKLLAKMILLPVLKFHDQIIQIIVIIDIFFILFEVEGEDEINSFTVPLSQMAQVSFFFVPPIYTSENLVFPLST